MEYIRDYLERLFARLPQNEELRQEKENMYQAAEKEYTQLLEQGMSQAQAVRKILNGFRNIDELASQYESRTKVSQPDQGYRRIYDDSYPTINGNMGDDYIKAGKMNAFLKATGVAAILLGIAITGFVTSIEELIGFGVATDLFEMLEAMLVLIGVGAGVGCFIASGKFHHKFDFLNKGCYITPSGTKSIFSFLEGGVNDSAMLIAGIILLIATPFSAAFFDTIPFKWSEGITVAFFFVPLTAGIFLLVYRAKIKRLQSDCHKLLFYALRRNELD